MLSILVLTLAASPAPGYKLPALTFKDTRYLTRSLDDFAGKKAFVLVFTDTACPLVQRYLPTLRKLEKDYRGKDVQFLAVNVGAEDSILKMAAQQVEHEMEFPFVKDIDGKCVAALGVKRTPEAVVLDAERRLRYRGRIDDQYRLGGVRPEPTRHDLKEALDAVLAGKEVEVKETPVDGCLITRAEPKQPKEPVTFAEHVAPILYKHCVECHRPGTAAPFALRTYKEAAARADMIAEVVADGRMPPWFASPEHGKFVNSRMLSAGERETVNQWARNGKPMGDEAKLPPVPQFEKGDDQWLIGKPDLVLPAPKHELPEKGDIPYKYIFLPYVFLDDTWVQGVQILPDNPRVVHHCNMAYLTLGEDFKTSNLITGYVPGVEPMRLDEGIARRIPKGSVVGLQIHYVATGKPETCQIKVGFRYARGTVHKELKHILLADYRFAIPPGAPAHLVKASKMLDQDVLGVGLFCHMHVRGRDMAFKAAYPDGKQETLLLIANYNFDWQVPYRWAPNQMRFPKGTRLDCIAHYDNSPFNPYNPDPKATVRNGLQTKDEMLNGFFFYVGADERLNLEIDPKSGRGKAKGP